MFEIVKDLINWLPLLGRWAALILIYLFFYWFIMIWPNVRKNTEDTQSAEPKVFVSRDKISSPGDYVAGNKYEYNETKIFTTDLPITLENKELSYEDEMAYKAIVSQIFNELKPKARVRINDSILGVDSKSNQKIDISIRQEIEGQELLTIIKAYAGKKPIDVYDLNKFSSMLNDVRASRGIIISNADFSDNARHLAPSLGIDLYSITDAQSKRWNEDIKIPVLYIKLNLNIFFQGNFYLEAGA